MKKVKYIAHIKQDISDFERNGKQNIDSLPDSEKQSLRSHLNGTAILAESYSVDALKDILFNAGLLHDIGKYQDSFQKKIRGDPKRVDHSTCGAIEAKKTMPRIIATIMEFIIAGHHSGLPDGGKKADQSYDTYAGHYSLYARLKMTDFDPYDDYKNDVVLKKIDEDALNRFIAYLLENIMPLWQSNQALASELFIDEISYLIRYCYSCLTDADSIDTEHFCRGIIRNTLKADFHICLEKLDEQLNRLSNAKNQTRLQKTRTKIQQQAFTYIHEDADIYLMNMPTGSGKTLCSAKCALMKALEEKKKHIIYVIPYNSIISQTADEFQHIFNKDARSRDEEIRILRHLSTYSIEDEENADDIYKLQVSQATENWDADFIITTEVQFFETMFSSKRSKLRKMHNMADSVLVFDEAHLLPVKFLQPCLEGIGVLTKKLGCKAILLTATMPDYRQLIDTYVPIGLRIKELVPDRTDFSIFDKCKYTNLGTISEGQILERVTGGGSTLVVVNTRRKARELFEKLGGEERKNLYHLSTLMTKRDLQDTIDEIKSKLEQLNHEKGGQAEPIIVISTSLIEAGVDLDFENAYREITGLDSILQTGGRCNREGRRKNGNVFIFEITSSDKVRRAEEDPKVVVTRAILEKYKDLASEECIKEYYKRVYLTDRSEIVEKSMHSCMKTMGLPVKVDAVGSIPFASYDVQMIISHDESLIIPECDEAVKIIRTLKYGGVSGKILRSLQQYTCSVPRNMMEELLRQGVIENISAENQSRNHGGVFALSNMNYYDRQKGILTEGKDYYVS